MHCICLHLASSGLSKFHALVEKMMQSIPSAKDSIVSIQSTISSTITSPGLKALRSELEFRSIENRELILENVDKIHSEWSNLKLDLNSWSNAFSIELSNELESIMNEFKADFPNPSTAPSHEQRVELIGNLMDRIEVGLVKVSGKHGISEDETRSKFVPVKEGIVKALVLIGDLVEQHPILFEAALFSATILFMPEVWLTQPILSCFGFGPLGPVKGSTAVWAQRRFFGAVVSKGSWFARLQQAGMRGWGLWKLPQIVLGAVTGGIGWSIFKCRF
ncbi:hypothetical protein K435DRAFT_777143 [Dendrothele bispora CBS 962.96]|uniref:Uncharacterized protein n=1 Tax=Dendrothele bispora (strain CBS 962.96) TaxID=1314807 RepID=A0A4S8M9V6_DENBC|nr:hypothetical protein K435DRAFT_777143 [Dendrothele bispora CBS 962.96]